MNNLHVHMDPSWYLQKLWWTGVIVGAVIIVGTALGNRRRNRKGRKIENIKPE